MRISDWSSDVCSSDLDERLVAVPLVPGFEVQRREAADRGAIVAEMVAARRQRDLRAEVRGRDLEAEVAVMLGHHPVHLVDEDDVWRSEERRVGKGCGSTFRSRWSRVH